MFGNAAVGVAQAMIQSLFGGLQIEGFVCFITKALFCSWRSLCAMLLCSVFGALLCYVIPNFVVEVASTRIVVG